MTHPNKIRGNTLEREIVNKSKEAGLSAKRAYASDGRSLGFSEVVDVLVEDVTIQAKRKKKGWLVKKFFIKRTFFFKRKRFFLKRTSFLKRFSF